MTRLLVDLVRTLALVVLLLAAAALIPQRAHAAPGIDVVILVDQSGSMWGHTKYHPGANDKHGHRIDAVKEVVDRLGADAEGSTREHRISIIDFDSRVIPYRQDLVLRRDPKRSDTAVERARAAMLMYNVVKHDDRPWTNTSGAIAAAVKEFAQWRSSGATDRQAHLLLITDGRPYMDAGGRALSLGELRQDIGQSGNALKDNGVQIWVVGINDADSYWTQAKGGLVSDGDFWRTLAGDQHASLAQSPSFPSVQRIVAGFVDGWLGTKSDTVIPGQPYEVPPFLRRVTFSVSLNEPGARVDVIDPQGRPLTMPTRDPTLKFVRIAVSNPEPGPYQFVLDPGKGYAIRAELLRPLAELVSPVGRQPADTDTSIVVRALGDVRQALPLVPAQVAAATLTVNSPTGQQQSLSATADAGARFSAPWRTAEVGQHAVTISAEATYQGRHYPVFDAEPVAPAIEVSRERPLYLSLTDPSPDEAIIDFPPIGDLDITLALVDGAGTPVGQVADYIAQPAQWLSVVPTDVAGVALGPPIPLTFGSDNRWHGSVPVNADWTTGAGWYIPAQMFLRFQPAQDRLAGDHVLNGLSLPSSAIDRRVGGNSFSVGPIEVRWPAWLRWAIFVTAALVLIGGPLSAAWLIARSFLMRSLDDPRKGRLELRIFDSVRDPHGLSANKVSVQGVLRLNKDKQIKTEIAGKPVIIEKFRYARSLQARRRAMARVIYRWPGQKKDGQVIVNADGPPRLLAAPNYDAYSVALAYKK